MKKLVEALCGKEMEIEVDDSDAEIAVEAACHMCPEETCVTYFQYFYAVTHYNNPR
jgi:hypothetical protein